MTIKLKGSTDGSVSLSAPADTSPTGTDITLTLPTDAGSANQFLKNSGTAGTLDYSSMVEDSSGNVSIDAADGKLNLTKTGLRQYQLQVTGSGTSDGLAIRDESGATEIARFTRSGNVGIGSTSPALKLHVEDAGQQIVRFARTGIGAGSLDVDSNGNAVLNSHTTNASVVFHTQTTERMRIDSSGNVGIGRTPTALFDVDVNGNALHIGYGTGFDNYFTSGTSGVQIFRAGTNERMRINSSGHVSIGTTATNWFSSQQQFVVRASTATGSASLFLQDTGGEYPIEAWNAASGGTRGLIKFRTNGAGNVVGAITTNGSSTTYSTSSDYRLKENVVDIDDGITRVKQLSPKRFNFIADADTTVDGFLAHEAQTVVPEAVTGTYNEVDEDGNPVYQGIDQSKLVPLLTAALQEAIAKIETLEAKVAALEAA